MRETAGSRSCEGAMDFMFESATADTEAYPEDITGTSVVIYSTAWLAASDRPRLPGSRFAIVVGRSAAPPLGPFFLRDEAHLSSILASLCPVRPLITVVRGADGEDVGRL